MDQADYFPVTYCGRDHHAWRNWCLAFPMARVWPVGDRRVYHAEDLPPCKDVVVGIPGIPSNIALQWMMNDVRPMPEEVRNAMVKGT